MAFSMHSHSGQFCPSHARGTLEEMVQQAIAKQMTHFALTEHMPRTDASDLYPEEVAEGVLVSDFIPRHESYLQEALRLRAKYQKDIEILIGFEGEWIRSEYGSRIEALAQDPAVDFFIGSVHHVNAIPIDHNTELYDQATQLSGGTLQGLYADYYDLQFEMLVELKPRVVGHFDLIKLLSAEPGQNSKEYDNVWKKIQRNLKFIVGYGGLIEINSSGLRKGLPEPYPGRIICEEAIKLGGRFTLSDDSHFTAHVATNYELIVNFLEAIGVQEVYVLERRDTPLDSGRNTKLVAKSVRLSVVKASCSSN